MKLPFSYAPEWDHDGAPDGHAGVDHFVIDGDGDQVACPPDEAAAILIVRAVNCHADLLGLCEECWFWADSDDLKERLAAVIAKARGE